MKIGLRTLKDATLLLIADACNSIAQLGVLFLLAWYLEPLVFGQYSLVLAYCMTLFPFFCINTWELLFYSHSRFTAEEQHSERYSATLVSFIIAAGTAIGSALVAWLVSPLLGPLLHMPFLVSYSLLAGGMLAARNITVFFHGFYRQIKQLHVYTVTIVVRSIVEIVLFAMLIYQQAELTIGLILALKLLLYAVEALILFFFMWVYLLRTYGPEEQAIKLTGLFQRNPRLRPVLWHGHFSLIWANIYASLDILAVGYFTGSAMAGSYRIAKQGSLAVAKLIEPIYYVLFPRIMGWWRTFSREKLVGAVKRLTVLLALIFVPLNALVNVAGIYAIDLFNMENAGAIIQIFTLLLWLQLFRFILVWNRPLLIASDNTKAAHAITAGSMTVSLILLVPMAMVAGATGIALATGLFNIVYSIAATVFLVRVIGRRNTWSNGSTAQDQLV